MRIGRLAPIALLAAAPWLNPPASAEPAVAGDLPPGTIRVRLFDPYDLLPDRLEEQVRDEARLAFAAAGAPLRFVTRAGPGIVPATVYPEIPAHWTTASGAIGVAVGHPGGPRSIFLSVGEAERALGIRPPAPGKRARRGRKGRRRHLRGPAAGRQRLGIALGRILAHELVHAVAPACPHTAGGLMAPQLTRRDLTGPSLAFGPVALHHLREAVGEVSGSG